MRKRSDMFINYDKTYRKRRRMRSRIKNILFVFMIAIVLGTSAYIGVKANIKSKNNKDSSDVTGINNTADSINKNDNELSQSDNLKTTGNGIVTKPTDLPNQPTVEITPIVTPVITTPAKASPTISISPGKDTAGQNSVKAKGLYITASSAGSGKINDLMDLIDKTEINSVVIDVKDDHGKITYAMNSATAREIGAVTNIITDITSIIDTLKPRNIYVIARIVAFKDPYLAEQKQELAVKNSDGTIYRDNNGEGWVNPYNRKVWDYLVEIAVQAAEDGFDEVQFDYIRFSTGAGISKADFGEESKTVSRTDIITEFTKYIYDKIKPHGVYVSADVYGTIINSSVDAALVGQDYAEMAKYLDYICPMVYPSHFGEGNYGIKYPDKEPYNIISKAMAASNKSLAVIPEDEHKAIVRPWLQAFTATWIKNYMKYGGDEIRDQIEGVYSAGYDEWLLWNAAGSYSENGLLEE